MAYRVVVAGSKDIANVGVICDDCQSVISLPLATVALPPGCASCGKTYSPNTANALAALARFQREAIAAEANAGKPIFRFEIRQSES